MTGVRILSVVSGLVLGTDPYYEMNAANLNTMNSYIIPTQTAIDPKKYPELKRRLQQTNGQLEFKKNFENQINGGLEDGRRIHLMSSYIGIIFLILFIILLRYLIRSKKKNSFAILFDMLYEGIRNFFEEILGIHEKTWIKKYVVTLFFVILLSNLFGLVNDVIRFVFPRWLRNVTAPTGELEFNIALAVISVILLLYLQSRSLGFRKFLHEYFPITGKGLIEGNGIGAKIGDIIISLFIGILDIIGTFAKVISLSMRLFGNMSSGGILLNIAFLGLGGLTMGLFGVSLPALIPIIVYVQGMLVAIVQAFVFSLLVAIFIKMTNEGESIIADQEQY